MRWDPVIAASRGAVYLDALHPGWFNKINLSTLRMQSFRSCVLGQCFNSFWRQMDVIVRAAGGTFNGYQDGQHPFALMFGFNVPTSRQERGGYEQLGLAWKYEIRRRLRAAAHRKAITT